jgi:hypothetical protein
MTHELIHNSLSLSLTYELVSHTDPEMDSQADPQLVCRTFEPEGGSVQRQIPRSIHHLIYSLRLARLSCGLGAPQHRSKKRVHKLIHSLCLASLSSRLGMSKKRSQNDPQADPQRAFHMYELKGAIVTNQPSDRSTCCLAACFSQISALVWEANQPAADPRADRQIVSQTHEL